MAARDLEMMQDLFPPEPSALVRFYLGETPDVAGRYLRDIRAWHVHRLEVVHDYIQWLFPTRQRSRFSRHAPILTPADVHAFREDERLRTELLASLRQMLGFYGFADREDNGAPWIDKGAAWIERSANWLQPGNHNLLRLTRILDCLSTLGRTEHARALLVALEGVCRDSPGVVSDRTLDFWRGAVGGN